MSGGEGAVLLEVDAKELGDGCSVTDAIQENGSSSTSRGGGVAEEVS